MNIEKTIEHTGMSPKTYNDLEDCLEEYINEASKMDLLTFCKEDCTHTGNRLQDG